MELADDDIKSAYELAKKLGVDENKIKLACKLADEMGYLPLALSQACAYIKENKSEISDYLKLFKNKKNQRKYTLPPVRERKDYPFTVDTTWSISVDKIKEKCSHGHYLLNLCAFMAPERIPIELIKKGHRHLYGEGSEIFSDDIILNEAKSSLLRYSLVDYNNKMLSVHRLVQLVTRNNIDDELSVWIRSLIKTVDAILPQDPYIKK
jgi:hypothetical protein